MKAPCHLEGLLQTQCKLASQSSVVMSVLFRDAQLSDPVMLNLSNHKDTQIYFQFIISRELHENKFCGDHCLCYVFPE